MLDERVKIPIVVQQRNVIEYASGSDESVDRLAHGDPKRAEASEISRRLNRDFRIRNYDQIKFAKQSTNPFKLSICVDPLKHLGDDEVAGGNCAIG